MSYNSIVFREFTNESFQRIELYRQEEAERLKRQTTCDEQSSMNE